MNFIFEKLNLTFNHHLLCQKTSTFVGYLYGRKDRLGSQHLRILSGSRVTQTWLTKCLPSPLRFWVEKALQYTVILGITFRALYISTLTTRAEVAAHLPYNPLVISACMTFKFLNSNVLRCTCLLTLFLLFLDYSLYFRLDAEHLQAAQEIMVENGRRFGELNSGSLAGGGGGCGSVQMGKFWLKAALKRIWNLSSPALHFYSPRLRCFPALSPRVRAQLVVVSALTEILVVTLNIAICKCVFKYKN